MNKPLCPTTCPNPGDGAALPVCGGDARALHADNGPLTSHVALKNSILHLFRVMKRETEAAAGK